MTKEIADATTIQTNIVSADSAVALHSLELLLDVASNILPEGLARERILSRIQCEINTKKLSPRADV